jgi:hypothetical protein
MVVRRFGLFGEGVRDMFLGLEAWNRWFRRGGGGGARLLLEEGCLDGEAAREEARDEATMALAREDIWSFSLEMGRVWEEGMRRRDWSSARKEGRYSYSFAETKESSDEASSSGGCSRVGRFEGMGIGFVRWVEVLRLAACNCLGGSGLLVFMGGFRVAGNRAGDSVLGSEKADGRVGFGDLMSGF